MVWRNVGLEMGGEYTTPIRIGGRRSNTLSYLRSSTVIEFGRLPPL